MCFVAHLVPGELEVLHASGDILRENSSPTSVAATTRTTQSVSSCGSRHVGSYVGVLYPPSHLKHQHY